MKGVIKKLWEFSGSRNLSVFIFIMGLTYISFLVVFSMAVPLPWVTNIANLLPFKILYILFLINLLICEIKWIPVVLRRCRKPVIPETDKDFLRFKCKIESLEKGLRFSNVKSYFKRRGYSIQCVEKVDNSFLIFAYKGRFSPVGNILFHFAFLLILFGIIVSLFFRFDGNARVTEGYAFTGTATEYSMLSASPFSSLPKVSFILEKITPMFWADELLFIDLRADIRRPGSEEDSTWISSPIKIDGAKITINSISLTPMYSLKNKDGRELDTGYVNLAIFAPGSEDHFQIPGFPHQFFVSFYPDFEMEGDVPVNRSMNVENPRFFVKVYRGRIPVFSGFIRLGEEVRFENLRLSFPEFRYWGDFRIVKDPGLAFVWTAFVFFVLGLVWRLLFYRREIAVIIESGKGTIYGNSDYYPSLFKNRLRVFKKMVEA